MKILLIVLKILIKLGSISRVLKINKVGDKMTDELIEVDTIWTLKDTNYKIKVVSVTNKK